MPWPTYSERILHHSQPATWTWTCPEGRRAIITQLDVVNSGELEAFVTLWVGPIILAAPVIPGGYGSSHTELRCVVYQLEVVSLAIANVPCHATVSAHLLQDASGATGPPLGPEFQRPDHIEQLPASSS